MKKIMFNDQYQLTQLVLEGYKTMTRRAESGVRIHEATNEAVQLALELHKSCRAGKSIITDDVSRIECIGIITYYYCNRF